MIQGFIWTYRSIQISTTITSISNVVLILISTIAFVVFTFEVLRLLCRSDFARKKSRLIDSKLKFGQEQCYLGYEYLFPGYKSYKASKT